MTAAVYRSEPNRCTHWPGLNSIDSQSKDSTIDTVRVLCNKASNLICYSIASGAAEDSAKRRLVALLTAYHKQSML